MNPSMSPLPVRAKGQLVAHATTGQGKPHVHGPVLQDKTLALDADDEDKSTVLRALLRQAIDDSEWKDGAVAEFIGLKGESGAAYFSKMLSGEKPIGTKHLMAMPDDVQRIFSKLYAESFGHIVVAPITPDLAIEHFVSGLFSLISFQLPARATRMAKASIGYQGSERRRA